MAARRSSSLAADLPFCGYTFDGATCEEFGEHFCLPRADRAQGFIENVCVHTKSVYARKAFILDPWQRDDIVRPLFGTVRWEPDWVDPETGLSGLYVRRYTLAWIELGRGNGKSELAAAIVLLLLVGDDEESSEVYGAATDIKQAGKVGEVVKRMAELSRPLERLEYNKQAKRLIDPVTNSYYEVIPGDADGELGHNPFGVVIDEFLTQADPDLFTALKTAQGKRPWSLVLCFTTAGDDPSGFAAQQHKEMEKIADDPGRAPHTFVYLRNTPGDADPWDERNWYHANPGLGRFLSIQTLRTEALEARNDPSKENGFRQFRLNQWVNQASRWMPMHLYDKCVGDVWLSPDYHRQKLAGGPAWAGFDLAAKFDLVSWCLLVPKASEVHMLWRFWLPEEALTHLDKHNDGKFSRWAKEGWITVTEGNVVDYDRIYADIERDGRDFDLVATDADQWSMAPVIQEIEKRTGVWQIDAYNNTYQRMTPGMTELMGLVKESRMRHHGNPVARFCFDSVEVRKAPYDPELIRPDKPDRGREGKRIDAVPSAAMACSAWKRAPLQQKPANRRVVVSSR